MVHQVIIVGAGPGGAYLAYLLARQGIDVLVIEKEQLPRHKPCGGGLTPKVIKLVDFDLSPVIEDVIYNMVITHCLTDPIKITTDEPIIYTVSRDKFDAYLLEKARAAGAQVVEKTKIERIQQTPERVTVASSDKEWQCSTLVGADGAYSIVARTPDLACNNKTAKVLQIHVPLSSSNIEQYRGTIKVDYGLVPAGYAWIFPKTDYLSVGVGSINPKIKKLPDKLASFVQAEGLVDEIKAVSKQGWTIPINLKMTNLQSGRILLVGDAAGLANGHTGEGIYQALLSASIAAEVISEQIKQPSPALNKYSSYIKEKIGQDQSNAFKLTQLFYPAAGMIHHMISRQNNLALEYIKALSGDIPYTQMLSSFRKQLPGALLSRLSTR